MTGRWHHLLELSYIHPRQRSVSNHLVVVLPSPLHRPTSSLSPRDHGQMHHCTRCSRIYAPACQCTFVKQLPPASGGATKELACLSWWGLWSSPTGCLHRKKGLWRLHHIPWMIGVYNIYSRDFKGTQKEQRVHQNCDEPPSQPKTHPPERQSDARVKSRSKPLATKPPARPFQVGKSKITPYHLPVNMAKNAI